MTCQHCGADLPPIAMFCGECGRSVTAAVIAPVVVDRPVPPVTAQLDPVTEPEQQPEPEPEPQPEPEAEPQPEPEPEPESAQPARAATGSAVPGSAVPGSAVPDGAVSDTAAACDACGTAALADDLYCAECGQPLGGDTRVIDPLPAPLPLDLPTIEVDTESTRLVPRHPAGAPFVLQFSTGESYTVLGSGLAGRNPRPEPGEYVDHLVTIVDPGRSVSKTHLEFGQADGVFWVCDRHSGNGSVVREPGREPRQCEPGRRYPVVRGTRIDLGEQHVIVT
ncbi:MAG: zinc ribbon domain-containing protein [Microcella sp.]|uniref:zinc-ribbon domain-containing protein n=1 Tax=Microcella sp. TaxID=1913979 RepID=UPI0024CAB36F|nr:zinc-ribbon domain-containing protein [Microcella sp.]UYN83972.1 MAG: zinc ribbon domain-containing protein [Microcella sp.]